MLPRRARLRRDRDFQTIFRDRWQTRTARGRFVTLRLRPGTTPTRYGFVVSTKTAKRAVDRNRIKRRLRHLVRIVPGPSQTDIVVIAAPAALTASVTELRTELQILFTNLDHVPNRRRSH